MYCAASQLLRLPGRSCAALHGCTNTMSLAVLDAQLALHPRSTMTDKFDCSMHHHTSSHTAGSVTVAQQGCRQGLWGDTEHASADITACMSDGLSCARLYSLQRGC